MARPLRLEYPGAVYHVMNRGLARQAIFQALPDYEMFLQALYETPTLWGVEVLAYCLLPNHYHLCVRTPAGNLGRVMQHLKLQETATHLGVKSYEVVGWACAQVRTKQVSDSRFKKRVEQVETTMSLQKI
ncbi:MAG: transposase [Nitrospirales bacterium]